MISGPVVPGRRLGRVLGFPTANVGLGSVDVPPSEYGVYAGYVGDHPAAISIGIRPTIGAGLEPLAEAHLLDFEGDLYGRTIDIELVARVREERRFPSTAELTEQIRADVREVRRILAA